MIYGCIHALVSAEAGVGTVVELYDQMRCDACRRECTRRLLPGDGLVLDWLRLEAGRGRRSRRRIPA